MTANELADEVMEHYKAESPRGFNVNWMKEVATMLRQQAKEIGMLKQIIDANNLQSDIGQFKKGCEIKVKEIELKFTCQIATYDQKEILKLRKELYEAFENCTHNIVDREGLVGNLKLELSGEH